MCIIIIIIIINEEIIVAFSPRTTRTRYKVMVYCYLSVFRSKVASFVGLLPVLAACHIFLLFALANKD